MLVPRAACVRDSVPLSVSGDMVTCRHSAPTTRDMGSRVAEGAESGCPVGTLASYYLTYAGGGHSHPLRVRKSPETRRSWRGGNLKVRRPLAEEQAELRHAARQQAQMPVHGVVAPTHLLLAQAPDRSVPGVPATHSTRGGVWSSPARPALLRTRPTSFAAHRRRQSVLAALFPGLRAMRGGRTPAASCVLCAPRTQHAHRGGWRLQASARMPATWALGCIATRMTPPFLPRYSRRCVRGGAAASRRLLVCAAQDRTPLARRGG